MNPGITGAELERILAAARLTFETTSANIPKCIVGRDGSLHDDGWHIVTMYSDGTEEHTRVAFSPCEVEAAKAYGSARYQEAAADCDQLRVLKMELDYQEEQERYRMDNAELLGWMTDADVNEASDADELRLTDEWTARVAATHRSVGLARPGDTFGDWAQRNKEHVGWMPRRAKLALFVERGGTLRPEHVQL